MLFNKEIQNDFLKKIDSLILTGDYGYIDSVLIACELFEIEPATVAKILPKPIIEKIEREGKFFNMLPKKSPELPV